jgi:hypothetical protein
MLLESSNHWQGHDTAGKKEKRPTTQQNNLAKVRGILYFWGLQQPNSAAK